MDGGYFLLLEEVGGEEGGDEEHNGYEEGPGGEELLLGRVASCAILVWSLSIVSEGVSIERSRAYLRGRLRLHRCCDLSRVSNVARVRSARAYGISQSPAGQVPWTTTCSLSVESVAYAVLGYQSLVFGGWSRLVG